MACEWTAYLDDGRSINEKDLFVEGEDLPFKKLVHYCVKNDIIINAITVAIDGIRFNSPSLGERGNFNSTEKPERFWIQYRERFLPLQGKAATFLGMSWKLGDIRTQQWIKISGPTPISWIEIRKATGGLEMSIEKNYAKKD